MMVTFKVISLETKKQFEIVDITKVVKEVVQETGLKNGMVTISCPHTTAAVRLNHNEPLLLQDIMKMIYRLIPVDIGYAHDLFEIRQAVSANERSNGHAHVKAFLLGSSESIPVHEGNLILGEKQSIFFIEFDGGRSRKYNLSIMGE